jgi:hypothetical protein
MTLESNELIYTAQSELTAEEEINLDHLMDVELQDAATARAEILARRDERVHVLAASAIEIVEGEMTAEEESLYDELTDKRNFNADSAWAVILANRSDKLPSKRTKGTESHTPKRQYEPRHDADSMYDPHWNVDAAQRPLDEASQEVIRSIRSTIDAEKIAAGATISPAEHTRQKVLAMTREAKRQAHS